MAGTMGERAYQEIEYDGTTDTIYDILTTVLTECVFGLYAVGVHDDSVVDELMPKFTINAMPYDDATEVIYRLLNMCYLFLRPENDTTGSKLAWFRLILPSALTSSQKATYYSDGQDGTYHGFTEFEWRDHAIEPNHIYVFANQAEDGTWDSIVTGEYDWYTASQAGDKEWKDIIDYYLAPELTAEAGMAGADERAEIIQHRIAFEGSLGRLVVPHDCSLELYDLVEIQDKRGLADYVEYPATASKWVDPFRCMVGSLVHIYSAGVYSLEIGLNGIQITTSMDSGAAIASAQAVAPPTATDSGTEAWTPSESWPEPPLRKISDYINVAEAPPLAFEELRNLTPYAQMRAQELLESGFMNERGEPTPKGLQWAKEHPTEEAPRTYTANALGGGLYLARATQAYAQGRPSVGFWGNVARYFTGKPMDFGRAPGAPNFPGAEAYARGEIPYSPYELMQYQVAYLQKQAAGLRTREQIMADVEAGGAAMYGGPGTYIKKERAPEPWRKKGLTLAERARMAHKAGKKYF